MWPNLQFPADLVTFNEEILNEKFNFLWSDRIVGAMADILANKKARHAEHRQ